MGYYKLDDYSSKECIKNYYGIAVIHGISGTTIDNP